MKTPATDQPETTDEEIKDLPPGLYRLRMSQVVLEAREAGSRRRSMKPIVGSGSWACLRLGEIRRLGDSGCTASGYLTDGKHRFQKVARHSRFSVRKFPAVCVPL